MTLGNPLAVRDGARAEQEVSINRDYVNTKPFQPRLGTNDRGSTVAVAPRAATAEPSFNFWLMAHRALRGRYTLALTLAAGLAVAGAVAGASLGKRLYSATGLVRIAIAKPAVLRETDQNRPIPNFDGFIAAQKDVMSSPEVVQAAMESEAWTRLVASGKSLSASEFSSGLKIETKPRSDHLRVTFTNSDPDVAAAAVQSVIDAFKDSFSANQDEFENGRVAQLQTRRDALAEELAGIEEDQKFASEGVDFTELDLATVTAAERVKKLRASLSEVQTVLAGGPDFTPKAATQQTPEDVAADDLLRLAVLDLGKAEAHLAQTLGEGYSREHRVVQRLERIVSERQARVTDLTRHAEERRASGESAPAAVPLQDREANLLELVAAAERELSDATTRRTAVADLADQASVLRRSLQETDARMDALATEATMGGRLSVVRGGEIPMTALVDNRAKAAAMGALLGGASPFALFLAGGMLRRRLRFSDDIAHEVGDRVPSTTAIPNLGSSANASNAAVHAVHNLRLRLQPRTASDRRTILISGPDVGEGKSNLALSMAMSFVSAGFRTLLIDADLATRRLSDLLEAGTCPGVLDASRGGEPLLWRTGAGFAFLAAGTASVEDGPRLPSHSTATLLTYLRDRFDVVLIDSDSIVTGSNAPTLAPLVDGVVLTFERGQSVTLVHNAADSVESLGGVLAAAAFNKSSAAEAQATRQAVSQAGPASRFGTLVDAMIQSLKLNHEDDFHLSATSMVLQKPGASKGPAQQAA